MVALRRTDINSKDGNFHAPVMASEVITGLNIKPDGVYIDATFGRGGHSSLILGRLGANGRLFASDRDASAVSYGQELIKDERFTIKHADFSELTNLYSEVDGVLFDLGVSSPQLDNPSRGFSFMRDGPLDMRMDNSKGVTAADWLRDISESSLSKVLWQYGQERYARRIARAIVLARVKTPFVSTKQLAEFIVSVIPRKPKNIHPATRSFQAIRIAINDELTQIEQGLKSGFSILAPGGRLVVISFHSLEDRIVKQTMRWFERGDELPRGLPVKDVELPNTFRCVGRAIKPKDSEIIGNPRARSAVLRVGEKLT